MNVPECVLKRVGGANDMACEEMGHGPTQTGDVCRVTDGTILETAPPPQDAVCEVCSVSCKPPNRGRLRDREPALKRSVPGARLARGRLKWRRIESSKFGKHESPCEHVYGGRRAARHEWYSRDARNESR